MQLGHDLEVHAIDRGEQGRRQEDHRHHREQLDDVVLLDGHEAEGRVEKELHLARQERGVFLDRLHVAQAPCAIRPGSRAPAAGGASRRRGTAASAPPTPCSRARSRSHRPCVRWIAWPRGTPAFDAPSCARSRRFPATRSRSACRRCARISAARSMTVSIKPSRTASGWWRQPPGLITRDMNMAKERGSP